MRGRRLTVPGLEIAALGAVGGYALAMAWCMNNVGYDIWGAFVIAPVLVLISVPLLRAAVRHETEARLGKLLLWAFALKLLAAIPRYLAAVVLYGGNSDAAAYDHAGAKIGAQLRSGDFHLDVGSRIVGTGFVKILTGAVYAITGPSIVGAFLIFTWLGFWGIYLCYRAFVIAVPDGNHWRYGCLVFLLPSMLFWPSSLGKEAWMTLCIGMTAYGFARLYTRGRFGFALMGAGLAGAGAVRPHIAVILLAAGFAGYIFRPAGPRATALSPIAKVVGVGVLLVVSIVAMQRVATFFQIDQINAQSVDQVLANTEDRTSEGGSAFQADRARGPLALPGAAVQVLVRPFPWEVHNVQGLATSLEGVLLVVIAVRSRRSILALPRQISRSYVIFATLYAGFFIYAFSTFGNFGIIARERVQVLPFVIALLCLPVAATSPSNRRARATGADSLVHT
jgi:hypothetical protein